MNVRNTFSDEILSVRIHAYARIWGIILDNSNRSEPLKKGRRIPITVNLAPDIHRELGKIEGGNKSAAIERLVREHIARRAEPATV
jgi:hypothetical protein